MDANFINAVNDKDIVCVRVFITNELGLDPRGISFHEMLAFAESNLDNLYEIDNGKRSVKDIAEWDDFYLSRIKTEVENNFSREKLAYYETVAKHVLKDKARQMDETAKKTQSDNNEKTAKKGSDWFEKNKKGVYVGTTIGGAIMTTIGLCMSKAEDTYVLKTVLTVIGAIGLVAGGYLLYKEISNNSNTDNK